MSRKRRRLIVVLVGLAMLGGATALVLAAFNDNLVFFYSPSDIKTKHVTEGRRIRIGGLVAPASVTRDGKSIAFRITDGESTVPVTYSGVVPDLFRGTQISLQRSRRVQQDCHRRTIRKRRSHQVDQLCAEFEPELAGTDDGRSQSWEIPRGDDTRT